MLESEAALSISFKGSVNHFANLPTKSARAGDVWRMDHATVGHQAWLFDGDGWVQVDDTPIGLAAIDKARDRRLRESVDEIGEIVGRLEPPFLRALKEVK